MPLKGFPSQNQTFAFSYAFGSLIPKISLRSFCLFDLEMIVIGFRNVVKHVCIDVQVLATRKGWNELYAFLIMLRE
jgi:hypothetical protein